MRWGCRKLFAESRAPMLAGWLFADLLLVLFITAIASLSAPAVVPHKHFPVKTSSPTPSPSPTDRVLERGPHTIDIDVRPSDVVNPASRGEAIARLLRELRQKLAAQGLRGRVAGFILVFANGTPDGNGIGQAILAAKTALRAIQSREPGFGNASGLSYWSGTGNFEFKIFFFA